MNIKSIALMLIGLGVFAGVASAEYKFEVKNNTSSDIKQLLAQEKGKKEWGSFDIGSGIKAGGSAQIVWDGSTDESGCEWYFKSVDAKSVESDPAEFDFCEEDLVLEFND